jgi:hypothetical protein
VWKNYHGGVIILRRRQKIMTKGTRSGERVLRKRDGNFDGDDEDPDTTTTSKKKHKKSKKSKTKSKKQHELVSNNDAENVPKHASSKNVYQHIPVQMVKVGTIVTTAVAPSSLAASLPPAPTNVPQPAAIVPPLAAAAGGQVYLAAVAEMRDGEVASRTSEEFNVIMESGMTTPATGGSTLTKTLQDSFVEWRSEQGGTVSFENDKRAVQRYVRETLFSNLKFLRSEGELEYTGKFPFVWRCNNNKRSNINYNKHKHQEKRASHMLFAKESTYRSNDGIRSRKLSGMRLGCVDLIQTLV